MKNKLLSLVAVTALVAPTISMAVGLGSVRTYSNLNERLKAEIPVLSVKQKGRMSVSLAPNAEFAKRGVQRVDILNNLRFSLVEKNGRTYVRVSSTKQVTVPYLNFILQLNSPEGVVSREYAIFLDPASAAAPVKKKSTTKSVTAKKTSGKTRTSVSKATPKRPKKTSTHKVKSRLAISDPHGAKYGPVRSGETMWSIASYVRPSTKVGVNDMISALKSANPKTLSRTLPAGVVLNVPTIKGYKAFPGGYAPMPGTVKKIVPASAQTGQPVAVKKTETPVGNNEPKRPKINLAEANQPKVEDPKVEAPTTDSQKVELPVTEPPKVEISPKDSPKVELPKVETPEVEIPKVEITATDSPEVKLPEVETPEVEMPKVEVPVVEGSNPEIPEVQTPESEMTDIEIPEQEKPATVTPKVDSVAKVAPPKPEATKTEPAKAKQTPKKVVAKPSPPVVEEGSSLKDNILLIGGAIGLFGAAGGGLFYLRNRRKNASGKDIVLLDEEFLDDSEVAENDDEIVIDEVGEGGLGGISDDIIDALDNETLDNDEIDDDFLSSLDAQPEETVADLDVIADDTAEFGDDFDFDKALAELDEELAELDDEVPPPSETGADGKLSISDEQVSIGTESANTAAASQAVSASIENDDTFADDIDFDIDFDDPKDDLDLDVDFDLLNKDPNFESELAELDSVVPTATDLSDDGGLDFDLTDFDSSDKAKEAVDIVESIDIAGEKPSAEPVSESFGLDSADTTVVSSSDEKNSRLQMKLDLANSFASIDENQRARDLLNEIINEGTEEQAKQAEKLLKEIG